VANLGDSDIVYVAELISGDDCALPCLNELFVTELIQKEVKLLPRTAERGGP